jgi:UDP-N-acetylglucosamine 1-carboxyvinyltransferase
MAQNDSFRVQGGHPLKGTLTPSGNKNEALPALSACLMTHEKVTLNTMPDIGDVVVMGDILQTMGVKIEKDSPHTWHVTSAQVESEDLDAGEFMRLRAAVTLAAPLLYRCGKMKLPTPGGDKIGLRPLDTHLRALQLMGVDVYEDDNGYILLCRKGLQAADILLDEASVTGTENIIMAAVCARGTSTIYNAACEPHVQGLCRLLNSMGAKISGIGSNLLTIEGVSDLHGTTHSIETDYIEIGSFIGLAAATHSDITITHVEKYAVRRILNAYETLGVKVEMDENTVHVSNRQSMRVKNNYRGAVPTIESAIWPGVPADIISLLLVTATQCEGAVLFHEKLFESRLFFTDRLVGMGARIVLCDPHRAVVTGKSALRADHLVSPDIRAGVAMLIAALCAEGTSIIDNIYVIDRGYEKIDERLNALGAKIERVNN